MSPDTVLLTWSEVECLERRSNITHYSISYHRKRTPTSRSERINVTGLEATVTGLSPSTNYRFAIAAVNEESQAGPEDSFYVKMPPSGGGATVIVISSGVAVGVCAVLVGLITGCVVILCIKIR